MPRWLKRGIAAAVVLVVLGGGAELALRALLPKIVAGVVRDTLDLPLEHPVDVEMRGSVLFAALGGAIGDTDVRVTDAPVADGVTATLRFHADRLPFNAEGKPMRGATASVYVSNAQLPPVISMLTSGVADSGRTSDGDLAVGRTVDAFGFSVPIEATLHLSIVDGAVRVVPTGLSAVGFDLEAAQLDAATGGLLEPLLSPHELCVREQLPAGVELRAIEVTRQGVRLEAALADDFLSNPTQQEPGSCSEPRASGSA